MKLHDRLLLDNIQDELEGMEEEYDYGGESQEGEMSNSLDFERLKKLVSLLELSMSEKDVLNIGR